MYVCVVCVCGNSWKLHDYDGNTSLPCEFDLSLTPCEGDLPPFLTRMIEALMAHVKWCDYVLQTNPNISPEARENLIKQKGNLTQQQKLVNDQINLYRVSF